MNLKNLLAGAVLFPVVPVLTFGGAKGMEGYALGIIAATVNLGGLWLGIKLLTRENPNDKAGLAIAVFCFLKMPVFLIAGFLSWRVGTPAPATFLVGVALVYSLTIWRALKAH